jgi:outer membrane protein assembly factor BamB
MRRLVLCASLCAFSATSASAADPARPQFRGPEGSGVAESEKPPTEIGPDKNVLWKVKAPPGFSSPIVVGDLLVLTAFDDGRLTTIAYDRASGAERWRAVAPHKEIEPHHPTEGSPAASTPVTDGTRIISYFGSCGLFSYDVKGQELWRLEMPTAHTVADFGTGVSPVLVDGLVILVRDQAQGSKIIAVNATTGKLQWETARQSTTSHSTPAIARSPNGSEIIVPAR